ncbi:MAG: hypothetical protein J6S67_06825, partial [Methanobrevibacter sp.]|nr:hypothetical protein [Methanobrevibacter sp.]
MSDFFMPTQKNDYFSKYENKNNNQNPNTQTDYWQNQSQKTMEQKQAQLDNRERYGVSVPDEYYDVFNKIISQAESPEKAQEEAYKIGSAIRYSQMMSIPLEDAYKNVDALNEAQFPDKADQKGRFEAISDMFTLGKNNVKLGELGQKLMKAHRENDTELAQSLMAEIDAINQQNQLMQDNAPRSWVMQALEAGAQSLPFTGAVAGAGILGNFIAPAVGTGASFAASSYLSAGTEYIDMLANGASPETARAVAMVSGGIQGIIEADIGITKGIVKGAARIAGKEVAESTAKKSLEEIGRKVFKRFHFGAGKKVLINYLENRGKDILGEGTEEFLQEITSIVGQEVAASLDGYDIPDDDFKHIVKQTTEAFRGGVLGALSMGFIPAGLNAAADVKSFKAIKDGAEVIESEEVFKDAVKDNPVFEGMSDQQKTETIHDVWERAQNRKEEAAILEAQKIAEGRDATEGAEEAPVENEEGITEPNPVARNEAGRLYTSDDVSIDDAGNVTGGTFVIGDKTKIENNRYGYITYSTAENGDITIDTFKMTEGREGLRGEAFDEFAREHPDVKIDWNAIGSEAQGFKNELIEANPSGSKNGLSYYSSDELENVTARKKVADEVRKNIHNVKRNADGSFTRTELSNKQVAAAVTLIESAARRMNMDLNDYVSKTFGNQIFGSREEFTQATLAQGENVNTKAGGMTQGVAQANWREVGQQVKAVIYAGENADFSTWAHEMAHVFQAQLDGELKTEAETAFNVVGGDWTRSTYTFSDGRTMSSAEAFAYGFQDWLETGKAESEQMKNIFQKFAEFIADAYNKLRQHLNFTPEIESVFNKLLDGDDTIMSKALKAAQEQEGEYRANLKRQAEEKQVQKKEVAKAEREEASEGTDFSNEEAEQSTEEIEKKLDEVTNENEPEGNAIDNALEDLPLTDEEKDELSEVLNDEYSTVVEKAEAMTEAASSAYNEDDVIPDELFFMDEADVKEINTQEDYVRKQYEGTEQWMKAPNGQPTKLTEKQWLQVRTTNFKRWFGNWELAKKVFNVVNTERATFNNKAAAMDWAEKNIIGLMNNEQTGGKGEINISNKSIDEMLNLNQRIKSSSNEVHYAALTKLREIIHDSEIVDAHPDYAKDKNGNRTPLAGINKDVNVDVLYGALSFEGEIYRVKTTIKRYVDENANSKAYAYDVQKIEVLPGIADNGNNTTVSKGNTSITGDILLQGVRKVNQKVGGDGELALEDYSKVLDENGEPLVVYHGSNQWFQVFNEGKTNKSSNVNTPDNTIFTNDNKEIASSFENYYGGRVKDVILDKDSPLHRKYD